MALPPDSSGDIIRRSAAWDASTPYQRAAAAVLVGTHATGLMSPLRVVHLDAEGTVLHQDLLTAGRRVVARGTWILELPIGAGRPDTGARLTVLPSSRS